MSSPDQTVTTAVTLQSPEWEMRMQVTVPAGPTTLRTMLPLVHSFTDAVVNAAIQQTEAEGKKISCRAGCGACCRQLVPISEIEARQIRDLVEDMPEPRRSAVRARFAEARQRLAEAGFLDKLLAPRTWKKGDSRDIGMQYFYLGIPCPFLEDESCSIHPVRPMVCREFLVTSPAANCARPTADTIDKVHVPLRIWNAVAMIDADFAEHEMMPWVALALAPAWADANPERPVLHSGKEWLEKLFQALSRDGNPAEVDRPE